MRDTDGEDIEFASNEVEEQEEVDEVENSISDFIDNSVQEDANDLPVLDEIVDEEQEQDLNLDWEPSER